MTRWQEVRAELTRYEVARALDDEIVLAWKGSAVAVRRLEAGGAEWLRVSAPVGYVRHASLEEVLRRADAMVGAVVVEGKRCVLRETVCLGQVAADAVHLLITTIAREAGELAPALRPVSEPHAYAEGFAT